MREQIDCFVPHAMPQLSETTLKALSDDPIVRRVIVEDEGCDVSGFLASSEAIRQIESKTEAMSSSVLSRHLCPSGRMRSEGWWL